jgi:hypothetical protein
VDIGPISTIQHVQLDSLTDEDLRMRAFLIHDPAAKEVVT